MADLTTIDLVNYNKLEESFSRLKLFNNKGVEVVNDITSNGIKDKIEIKKIPNNIEELSRKINLIELYLTIQSSLDRVLSFDNQQEENDRLNHQLLTTLSDIIRSLEVVEDKEPKLTDGIESNSPNKLFLEFVSKVTFPGEAKSSKELTKILLNDLNPNLGINDINQLIRAWGLATNLFVEDAQKKKENDSLVEPLKPATFAHFFGIHNELENLYSKLADTEILQ